MKKSPQDIVWLQALYLRRSFWIYDQESYLKTVRHIKTSCTHVLIPEYGWRTQLSDFVGKVEKDSSIDIQNEHPCKPSWSAKLPSAKQTLFLNSHCDEINISLDKKSQPIQNRCRLMNLLSSGNTHYIKQRYKLTLMLSSKWLICRTIQITY